jgi:hypothetical protein
MGYLDRYGEGDERREKIVKRALISLLILVVAGSVLYYLFKNFREERQVRHFYDLLQRQDYASAYQLWGCSKEQPCRDYSFNQFVQDWGPESPNGKPHEAEIVRSRSCGSGVIITTRMGEHEEKLWVQRGSLVMGFSPWPACPASGL